MSWAAVAGAAVGVVGGMLTDDGSAPAASNMPSMTPEQQQALRALLQRLQGGTGVTPYGGNTDGMEHSLAGLEEWSKQMMLNRAGVQGSANSFMEAGPDATNIDDMFKNSIENPLVQDFNENVIPGISKKFGGSSIFGTDARNADTKARSNLMSSLVGAKSKMQFDTTEAAKNRALQKNALGVDLTKAGLGADSEIGKMLSMIFGGQSAVHDTNYAEFTRQQGQGQQNIQNILAALGLQPNNTVVTPGSQGFLTAAAPGIGQALTQSAMNRWLGTGSGGGTGYTGAGPQYTSEIGP